MKNLAKDNDFISEFLDILEEMEDDVEFSESEESLDSDTFKDKKKRGYPAS